MMDEKLKTRWPNIWEESCLVGKDSERMEEDPLFVQLRLPSGDVSLSIRRTKQLLSVNSSSLVLFQIQQSHPDA